MNSSGVLDKMWQIDIERTFMLLIRKYGISKNDFDINNNLIYKSDLFYVANFKHNGSDIVDIPVGLCISHNDCLEFKDKQIFDEFEQQLINIRNSKWFSKSKTCFLEKLEILTES